MQFKYVKKAFLLGTLLSYCPHLLAIKVSLIPESLPKGKRACLVPSDDSPIGLESFLKADDEEILREKYEEHTDQPAPEPFHMEGLKDLYVRRLDVMLHNYYVAVREKKFPTDYKSDIVVFVTHPSVNTEAWSTLLLEIPRAASKMEINLLDPTPVSRQKLSDEEKAVAYLYHRINHLAKKYPQASFPNENFVDAKTVSPQALAKLKGTDAEWTLLLKAHFLATLTLIGKTVQLPPTPLYDLGLLLSHGSGDPAFEFAFNELHITFAEITLQSVLNNMEDMYKRAQQEGHKKILFIVKKSQLEPCIELLLEKLRQPRKDTSVAILDRLVDAKEEDELRNSLAVKYSITIYSDIE